MVCFSLSYALRAQSSQVRGNMVSIMGVVIMSYYTFGCLDPQGLDLIKLMSETLPTVIQVMGAVYPCPV